ncbi:MAG: energy transducer TonB [Candidatus Andeanibacterium colombiense]|uniref:Energy transducer TonB n=1 Tax=Candidatus Andeanibacterium colombiense TaxID=3121345 RepID=A0AAJ5X4V3_9SPHN|nr:MAG: energy transducer TonB [Sphingomonadaceae bacterium]
MSGNKIIAIVIVGLIHVAVGYALVTGLAYSAMKKAIERVTTVDVDEPEPEKTEEPPPPDTKTPPPPPIVAPPPPINISVAPPAIETVSRPPPPAPIVLAPHPAPPAPPPRASQARGVQPKGQSRWASRIQENYPARAVRSGTEGTVGVSVTVGPNGKVSACSVTGTSGSDVLDEAACDGMRRYAQFDPALDADGNPTSASWSTRIVYRLN